MATITPTKRIADDGKEASTGALTLPKPPGTKLKWEQAEPYLKALTPEQANCLETYAYRVYPVIIRQLSDPDNANYIDKIPGELTREYFLEYHGGGRYRLVVKNSTNNSQVCEIILNIPVTEADPKLVLSELDLNHKENKSYVTKLQIEGKIGPDGKPPMTQTKEQPSTDPVMASMMKDFMGYLMQQNRQAQTPQGTDLNGAIAGIFLEKMKQEDPSKQLTTMASLLGALKEMTPKTEGSIFEYMLKMQSENNRIQSEANAKQMELMLKLMEAKNPPAKDDEEDDGLGKGSLIDKMKTLMEFARELKGGRPSEMTLTDRLIDAGEKILPNLLGTINTFMTLRANGGGMGGFGFPQPTQATTPPMLESPMNNGQAIPNNNQPMMPPQPNVVQMPTQAQPSQPLGNVQQLQMAINQYGGLIVNHLVGGTPGNEFAELVVGMVGRPTFNQIAMHKDEDIIEAAKSIPQFWAAVETAGSGTTFGEPYFKKWLDDFRNFEEFGDEEEEETTTK